MAAALLRRVGRGIQAAVSWLAGLPVAVLYVAIVFSPRRVPDLGRFTRSAGFGQLQTAAATWADQNFELIEGGAPWLDRAGQYEPYVWYYTKAAALVNKGFGTVQSGDALEAEVGYNPATGGYTLSLEDHTRPGVSFIQDITSLQCAGLCDNTSAEVITQVFDGVANGFNLADYGDDSFTHAQVIDLAGHYGSLASNQLWQATRVQLVDPITGDALASPEVLEGDTTAPDAHYDVWDFAR
jgi:hypothetical protein